MELQSLKKIQEIIHKIKIGMLVTTAPDHSLKSRPMGTREVDDQGYLWFFTSDESGKLADIIEHPKVNIAYSSVDSNTYLSISGVATPVLDKQKMKELFSPMVKAWYPEGLDDPTLMLIRVKIQEAEYWDGTSSKLVQVFKMGKAIISGERYSSGEHEKLVN